MTDTRATTVWHPIWYTKSMRTFLDDKTIFVNCIWSKKECDQSHFGSRAQVDMWLQKKNFRWKACKVMKHLRDFMNTFKSKSYILDLINWVQNHCSLSHSFVYQIFDANHFAELTNSKTKLLCDVMNYSVV